MKISTYIFLCFLFILLLFSLTTYTNFKLSEAIKKNTDYATTSTEIMKYSGRFQRNILSMVSGLRGYLITGEKYFIDSYDSAVNDNETILLEFSSLITDTVQARWLADIRDLNNEWVEEYADPLKNAKRQSSINDSGLAVFNKLYREKFLTGDEREIQLKLQNNFKEFSAYEYDNRNRQKEALEASAKRAKQISITLILISLVVGLVVIYVLIRKIMNRISSMVNMANAIAGGKYDLNVDNTGNDELSALAASLNRMSQSLSQNIRLLKEKNRELDQFAHIVSHDLKSPLRGIDNVVSWIEEDHREELSPHVGEYMSLIKGRVRRAENLIEGILSYARIDKETIVKEDVDMNALVKEIVENQPLQPSTKVIIDKELPVLHTEKLPLLQVLTNLISNAIKHNDKENGEVHVYYVEHPAHYEFFIRDNGPGIAEDYHLRIFEIFQILKERDSFESTGIGLTIVKKILDGRGEQVKVHSELGKGAIFSFTWSK